MSIKGSAYVWFRHALMSGDPTRVRVTAGELPSICLADALAICFVFCLRDQPHYSRAAARWLGRLALEEQLSLDDLAAALEALAALESENSDAAAERLASLCEGWQLYPARQALSVWKHLRGG